MKDKIALIALAIALLYILPFSSIAGMKAGYYVYQAQSLNQSLENPKIQFFINAGYYQPSLKQLNDAVKSFNQTMRFTGYAGEVDENYPYKVVIGEFPENGYEGSFEELKGDQVLGGGLSYFFSPNLKLSLSISQFETRAVSRLSSTFWEERYYPYKSTWRTSAWRIDQSVTIRPLLLSVLYDLPIISGNGFIKLYGGGGLGFYFSTLKNTIHGDYGEPEPNVTTYNYQLTNNFQANTNPLGFHALAGISMGWKILSLNFDVSYHYANGKIDEWNDSTRMQYYVYGMAKQMMDFLNVKEIDLGGLLVRGGISFNF
ncbi:MAG: hypothetical protein AMS23_00840 [Bacteroides sp. SM1_62]|nr:MAG: hypothetical protein AMS23_00840 [Bacteroides sp. SM1_62]